MVLKKKSILLIMAFLIGCFMCACGKEDSVAGESLVEDAEEAAEQWEKGYDLPVDEQEKEEAETDCKKLMELYLDIYETADKGIASNVVLDDQTVLEIQKKVKDAGYPISTMVTYSNMENYESVDSFLKECMQGESGSVVIYEVLGDGGLGRMKFIFDGTDMYVVSARGIWNADNKPEISNISYTRLKEWEYTEKGRFCYELCVPEPPEVSEIVDGSCLIRVKPMTEEQREMSERLVRGLGYQGNNLLCSNWDTEHMEELDFNGMYEYLYAMKYGDKFIPEDYPNGIPKEAFESLIMEYIPVTVEQIREYAVFDEENQTYYWERLGCFNYAPTFLGTSLPEVVDIKENEDGTVTLTVDAVCDMVICDDAVITHELTVRFAEDGSFQYLGNEILNDGIMQIPDYQYRIRADEPEEIFVIPVNSDELFVSSEEGYNSIKVYKQENVLVINALSEAAFFDGVQFTVEIDGKITPEDIEIIWMTIGGNTEFVEGNDRIIAEIKISDNDELICDTKINFAKKAFDAIEDVLDIRGH